MGLIARYLLKEVTLASSLVFFALLLLFSFFDMINELGNVGRGTYGFIQVTLYVLLLVPGHMYEIVPIAALIGSLFALSRLMTTSEMTVIRTSGISVWRISGLLATAGLGFAFLALLLGEFVTPWAEQAAQKLKLQATESVVAQSFQSGLWVKDGNTFINAQEVLPNSSLKGLKMYEFNTEWELKQIMSAETGEWQSKKKWLLTNVSSTEFASDGTISIESLPTREWNSVLSPDILSVLLISPEQMSTPSLVSYIHHLRTNKQVATRYEIALWSKLLYPLIVPLIMILALPFTFQSPRSGSMATKVFLGILAGLTFHLSNRLFAHLGLLNGWPPFLTTMTPLLVFSLIAWRSLVYVERH